MTGSSIAHAASVPVFVGSGPGRIVHTRCSDVLTPRPRPFPSDTAPQLAQVCPSPSLLRSLCSSSSASQILAITHSHDERSYMHIQFQPRLIDLHQAFHAWWTRRIPSMWFSGFRNSGCLGAPITLTQCRAIGSRGFLLRSWPTSRWIAACTRDSAVTESYHASRTRRYILRRRLTLQQSPRVLYV